MGRDTPKDTPARSTCYLPAATTARHGLEDLYLFAVFAYEKVADVDHAAVAVAGDTPLEAGVVGFDGVVVIGGWVP
jgi:hypothetical protein